MLDRIRNTAGALRSLDRIAAEVAELRRAVKQDRQTLDKHAHGAETVSRQVSDLASSIDRLTDAVGLLQSSLQKVDLRTEQLSAIQRADEDDEEALAGLPAVLQADRVSAHVLQALDRSELHLEPFPHMVIDDLLPEDVYDAMIRAIPPRVLFEDRKVNKQQLRVPPSFAPLYARRVWPFITDQVIVRALKPGILARFRQPLTEYVQRFWPGLTADESRLPLTASDGRIILRRRGYVIAPHRDPRWGFLTVIMYLVRPDDPDTWGTQLYRVREDGNAPSALPHWIDGARCELVKDVPFRRNRALAFLNSDGAHGASIPEDAPADFERYIYQWRIGADGALIKRLMAQLTPEARVFWEGKEGY